jgi:two-component system sensor histidine kinase ChvG
MPISRISKPSMALDTATATTEPGGREPAVVPPPRSGGKAQWRPVHDVARRLLGLFRNLVNRLRQLRRRLGAAADIVVPGLKRISPLTRRILAVNVVALAVPGLGLLYLGQYQDGLIATQTDALKTQGQVFAAALGEGATLDQPGTGEVLVPDLGREMMRRLVEPTKTRARLYDINGRLLADTSVLRGPGGAVEVAELPAPDRGALERWADRFYNDALTFFPGAKRYPPYVEPERQSSSAYPEVARALTGDIGGVVQSDRANGGLVISVAVPVQHYRQVLGAVQLSVGSADIDKAVRSVRFEILKVFAFALCVTVLLSIYLAGTIARPIRRLAAAAKRVRQGSGRQIAIPDLTARRDEIGDLSAALREMTAALWARMDAIERFAADVAHEIKNPLTSLKSAIETARRVDDPEKERKLLALVVEDVERLNRLITDISNASRLDAELSRMEPDIVPLGRILATLADLHRSTARPEAARIELSLLGEAGTAAGDLPVIGVEGRLVQVFRNLIENAISFSPPEGIIRIAARRVGDVIVVDVEDDGPGLPPGKLEAIFERFYTERPVGEKFGKHSGLGLSISKQIVETHRGSLRAENRVDADGKVLGARFIVCLPAA